MTNVPFQIEDQVTEEKEATVGEQRQNHMATGSERSISDHSHMSTKSTFQNVKEQ